MKYSEMFDDLSKEFDSHIAMKVCMAIGIQLSIKLKDKDLLEEGYYTNRLIKKFKKVFWEETPEDLELIIKLWKVSYDYETTKTLQGTGGCEMKSFKQLIGEN